MERAAHPHKLLAELKNHSDHHASAVTRGTLCNTIAALAETGWIASQGQEHTGNRPERTVYALTEAGHAELVRRLDAQIRDPEREFSRFLGAVAHLGALGPDGAVDAPTSARAACGSAPARTNAAWPDALSAGVPRLHVIEAEYALALAHAELSWIGTVTEEIRTGTLPGPPPPRRPTTADGRKTRDPPPAHE